MRRAASQFAVSRARADQYDAPMPRRTPLREHKPMAALTEWKVPPAVQPRAEDYSYDLERALASVIGLHSIVPPDAFTADTLGVERAGNGVLIDDRLVLTIGYLITEAETCLLYTSPSPR